MTPQLPILKPRDVITALRRAGFYIHHQTGSHIQLKHNENTGFRVTIPFHHDDLPKPIIKSIIKQAELTVQEFLDLIE